jgi:hypothetical protein
LSNVPSSTTMCPITETVQHASTNTNNILQ